MALIDDLQAVRQIIVSRPYKELDAVDPEIGVKGAVNEVVKANYPNAWLSKLRKPLVTRRLLVAIQGEPENYPGAFFKILNLKSKEQALKLIDRAIELELARIEYRKTGKHIDPKLLIPITFLDDPNLSEIDKFRMELLQMTEQEKLAVLMEVLNLNPSTMTNSKEVIAALANYLTVPNSPPGPVASSLLRTLELINKLGA